MPKSARAREEKEKLKETPVNKKSTVAVCCLKWRCFLAQLPCCAKSIQTRGRHADAETRSKSSQFFHLATATTNNGSTQPPPSPNPCGVPEQAPEGHPLQSKRQRGTRCLFWENPWRSGSEISEKNLRPKSARRLVCWPPRPTNTAIDWHL